MRFKNWKAPKIEDGKMTQWNWVVQNPHKLSLGKKTDIGAFTYINALYGVSIGDNVQIGSHCSIYSINTIENKHGPVIIGENSCIGSHSTILQGVIIGKNCLIGAHTLVNKNIPDNSIAYGTPIKIKSKEK